MKSKDTHKQGPKPPSLLDHRYKATRARWAAAKKERELLAHTSLKDLIK